MALHERDAVREELDDSVFAAEDLTTAAPKYKFPDNEGNPRAAFQIVSDELMLDGNSRQDLATFCQTWEDPKSTN